MNPICKHGVDHSTSTPTDLVICRECFIEIAEQQKAEANKIMKMLGFDDDDEDES